MRLSERGKFARRSFSTLHHPSLCPHPLPVLFPLCLLLAPSLSSSRFSRSFSQPPFTSSFPPPPRQPFAVEAARAHLFRSPLLQPAALFLSLTWFLHARIVDNIRRWSTFGRPGNVNPLPHFESYWILSRKFSLFLFFFLFFCPVCFEECIVYFAISLVFVCFCFLFYGLFRIAGVDSFCLEDW